MTLADVISSFETTYRFELQKHGSSLPEILPIKLEALWLSRAIKYLQDQVREFQLQYTLPVDNTSISYAVPVDFGVVINIKQKDIPLEIVAPENLPVSPTYTITQKAAVFNDGTGTVIKFDVAPSTLNGNTIMWYYSTSFLYSPSGVSITALSNFNGDTFTGDFILDDKYEAAVEYFMLAKAFDEADTGLFTLKCQEEIARLINNKVTTESATLPYNMG